jgi:hypothetical protein
LRSPGIKTFGIGDAFVILSLVLATAFSYTSSRGTGKGEAVELTVGNGQATRYSLARDTILSVRGPIGCTGVEIRNGQVWISDSPCPQQVCRHEGKIRFSGQILICLPNRLFVEIRGSGDPPVDATTE